MSHRVVIFPSMNAHPAQRAMVSPTLGDWNRFCREKGIGVMRPCPRCGAPGQVGADESEDGQSMGPPTPADVLRMQTMTQECDNCGYQMTYSMRPFVDWLLSA